jgi:diaminohydroxyphosphoribosylaminopyrimidine deaminase/5-amino-6-(5-phosphoribosylamino)uracil reductase
MSAAFDIDMMAMALRMAQRGLGRTAPNPAVGAVIADETTSEIIARGWTQPGGRPHAETQAIGRAGRRARDATMYVTLEPCSHHGKTGPCANAIIDAGLKRVVVAIEDPDTRVAGRGLDWMRKAGIVVETGLMANEARWLTLGHILRVTEQRPFVQVKLALSADGEVPRGEAGQPAWVTSAEARAHGAMLRAEADAILVGARTIVDDDPLLTCRLPGMADRSPVRVVLSSRIGVPLQANVFATARDVPTWVLTSDEAVPDAVGQLRAAGVLVVPVAPHAPLDLREALGALADEGMTRLLVEGGPQVWRAFSDAGLIDEVVVFQADGPSADARSAAAAFINLDGLSRISELKLAQDRVTVFRAER